MNNLKGFMFACLTILEVYVMGIPSLKYGTCFEGIISLLFLGLIWFSWVVFEKVSERIKG